MSKQSTIDTITGLAVSFGASKATFNEGTFYTGDANVSGLIKGAITGILAQAGSAPLADNFNPSALAMAVDIKPAELTIDLKIPGANTKVSGVDVRFWIGGKARQSKGSVVAKGFTAADGVVGLQVEAGGNSFEALIDLSAKAVAGKVKPLSLQKLINRLISKPTALGGLVGVDAIHISDTTLFSSLGLTPPTGLASREAVLGPAGAQAAFGANWFNSGVLA